MMLPGRALAWCHVAWQVLFLPTEHLMKETALVGPANCSRTQSWMTEGSWDSNSTMLDEQRAVTGFEAWHEVASGFKAYEVSRMSNKGATSFELRLLRRRRRSSGMLRLCMRRWSQASSWRTSRQSFLTSLTPNDVNVNFPKKNNDNVKLLAHGPKPHRCNAQLFFPRHCASAPSHLTSTALYSSQLYRGGDILKPQGRN